MTFKLRIFHLLIFCFVVINQANAQAPVTLQPSGYAGKDAYISNYTSYLNSNFGSHPDFCAMRWSAGGVDYSVRNLIQFDLTSIPFDATITSATLTLYGIAHDINYLTIPASYKPNACYLRKITSPWNETTVTWTNQPSTSTIDQITVNSSTSTTQDYSFTVTNIVQGMVNDPESNFGFMLQLQNEVDKYSKMGFASSDYGTSSKWPKLVINYTTSDLTKNWTLVSSYGENGEITGASKTFYDYTGATTQTLVKDIERNDVLATQTVYDDYKRGVLQTLPVPIGQTNLTYKSGLILSSAGHDYESSCFDLLESSLNNPVTVSANCPLGYYYSNNNSLEPYVPASSFPYSRTEIDPLTLNVKRTAAPGEMHRMGSGHELYSFTMPVASEFRYLANSTIKGNKTVTVDANGQERVSFTDMDGKVIATASSGMKNGVNARVMHVVSPIPFTGKLDFDGSDYVDIHLPEGCQNTLKLTNPHIVTDDDDYYQNVYNIIDLKTGNKVLFGGSPYFNAEYPNLPAGFYRIIRLQSFASYGASFATYDVNYYDFSLNTYDKANRLVSVVPPLGIDAAYVPDNSYVLFPNHQMKCTYEYNSLEWLTSSFSPDEGIKNYIYRKDGKLRFSQNALQAVSGKFTYVNYDKNGRAVEMGEYDPNITSAQAKYYFQNYANSGTAVPAGYLSLYATTVLEYTADINPSTGTDPNAVFVPERCTQKTQIFFDVDDPSFNTLTGNTCTSYKTGLSFGKISKV